MLRAKSKNNILTFIDNAIDGDIYYCPMCNQPMMVKRYQDRSDHFAHYSPHGHPEIVPCSDRWDYCMTEWHMGWQKRFPVEDIERVLENNGKKHIADVIVGNYVVEFQHSAMSLMEFNRRNDFYTGLGYKVIWVFDLTEDYEDGHFAQDSDDNEWYYKWANPKKVFREMIFSEVNATIYIQLGDEEGDACVLERVSNVYHEGRHIKTSPNSALKIQEFVDMITENSNDIFEKPKPPASPYTMEGCKKVIDLWKPSYSSMLIKNNHSNYVIHIYGKEGRMHRDYKTGRIRCLYTYQDPYTGFYKNKGEYKNVFEEDKEIWTLVQSFKDSEYDERIAKQKKEMEEQEQRRQEYYKRTAPYREASQEGCLALNQLIYNHYNDIVYVENVYNHKTYMVVVHNGFNSFELYEVSLKNICKKLSDNLKDDLEEQIIFCIWKLINI